MIDLLKASNRKKYLRRLLYLGLILIYFAVSYTVMNRLGISCVFKAFFGIPCPGCGMTRAFSSLLRLDFLSALGYNPLIFFMPYVAVFLFFDLKNKRLHNTLIAVIGILAVINWLMRVFGILNI